MRSWLFTRASPQAGNRTPMSDATANAVHPRVNPGVPTGGQFTSKPRTDSDVTLTGRTLLAGVEAPAITLAGLTHIGTLNRTDKGAHSYEGQGLSVSQHPEEWGRIAKLGGTVWNIGPDAGAQFLNYHELTGQQREAIAAFGVAAGHVTVEDVFSVTYWDDEWEQEFTAVFRSRADAEDEAEEREGVVSMSSTLAATASFPDSTVKAGDIQVEDVLTTVWVEEVATDFVGVWWDDDFDPERLSAPRGVIVPRAFGDWVGSATIHS